MTKSAVLFDGCSTTVGVRSEPATMRPTCWENAMARIKRLGIRITEAEHQQLREAATRLEFRGPSGLVRQAIRNELARRNTAAKDAEEQVAATVLL